MNKKFYPFLWFLEYSKYDFKIHFEGYNPYFELSNISINHLDKPEVYVNLNYIDIKLERNLLVFYTLLLSKLRYEFLHSRLSLYLPEIDYCIKKWKYKSNYINDDIYIFLGAIRDSFESYTIYYNNNKFLIYLDYEISEMIDNKMILILEEFLPIGFSCEYIYDHFLVLGVEELSFLERWTIL